MMQPSPTLQGGRDIGELVEARARALHEAHADILVLHRRRGEQRVPGERFAVQICRQE